MIYEYTWPQFKKLNHIRLLSEQEQVRQYYFYLDKLANERMRQNKGRRVAEPTEEKFLLQEDLFNILQEDTSRIKLS
jgi:hypothetical protein